MPSIDDIWGSPKAAPQDNMAALAALPANYGDPGYIPADQAAQLGAGPPPVSQNNTPNPTGQPTLTQDPQHPTWWRDASGNVAYIGGGDPNQSDASSGPNGTVINVRGSANPAFIAGQTGANSGLSISDIWGGPQPGNLPQRKDIGLGIAAGLEKPLDNAAHWLAGLPGFKQIDQLGGALGLPTVDEANASHRQALADAAAKGIVPDPVAEFVANAASAIPISVLTKNPWLAGGAFGALNTDNPDDLRATAESAGLGAVGGKLGDVALNRIGAVIAPKIAPAAQQLAAEGVDLTPGQIAGGTVKRLEDAATSLPIVGDVIKAAQGRSLQGFNRAVVNRVLAPIGKTLPKDVPAGQSAVEHATTELSNAYEAVLPGLTVAPDADFAIGVRNLGRAADMLPEAQQKQFGNIVAQWVARPFQNGGLSMSGDAMKSADAEIGRLARAYRGSSATGERELGYLLADLQGELRDLVTRSNPAVADQLSAINQGWRQLVVLQRAAGSAGAAARGGVFTPSQLLGAARASDPSLRKAAFAQGKATMQDLATAGSEVLPSSVPDSGTATRGLLAGMILGGGHGLHVMLHPATGIPAAAVTVAYTNAGRKVLSKALTARPAWAAGLRNQLPQLKAPAVVAGARALPQLTQGFVQPTQ